MSEIEVVSAAPEDWEVVKALRLRALAEAPYAFGSTLAREARFDDLEWQRRVAEGHWFLARAGADPVAIAAALISAERPHECQLVAMWVDPDWRGTGTAATVVEAVCIWARAAHAQTLTLGVADSNPRARRLYERLGFTPTGERTPLPSAPEVGREILSRRLVN